MIHPILNLPSAGPFSSNFAELVYIPGFDFLYTQVDQPGDSLDGLNNIAGRVNISGEDPGGRFGARLDNRALFSGVAEETAPPFAMVQAGVPVAGCVAGCFYLSAGRSVQQVIPNATWGNSQIGFRLHTLVENAEVTAFWLWNHDYSPVARINNRVITVVAPGLALRRVDLFYPQYQAVGVTVNRPLYLPGALAQLPFVIRAETLYKNHDAFNTFAVPGTPATGFAGIGVAQLLAQRGDAVRHHPVAVRAGPGFGLHAVADDDRQPVGQLRAHRYHHPELQQEHAGRGGLLRAQISQRHRNAGQCQHQLVVGRGLSELDHDLCS
jgi:hypothetical protein